MDNAWLEAGKQVPALALVVILIFGFLKYLERRMDKQEAKDKLKDEQTTKLSTEAQERIAKITTAHEEKIEKLSAKHEENMEKLVKEQTNTSEKLATVIKENTVVLVETNVRLKDLKPKI